MTTTPKRLITAALIAAASIFLAFVAALPSHAEGITACRGQSERAAPAVRADVDGDGRLDSARVIVPIGSCPVLLVDGSRVGRIRIVLRQAGLEQVWPEPHTPPFIGAAATIDQAPGAELVVAMDWAAPTAFYAIYTARGNRLVRYRVSGAPLPDTFASGGPATFTEGFDCATRGGRSGELVTFAAQRRPGGRTKGVGRTLYRARGTRFVRLSSTHLRTSSGSVFDQPMLSRCAVAHGRPPR